MRIVRGGAWVNDDVSMLRCCAPSQGAARHLCIQRGVQNRMLSMIRSAVAGSRLRRRRRSRAAQSPVIVDDRRRGRAACPGSRLSSSMTVESRAKSPRDAQRQNADAMAAVIRQLARRGIPKDAIRTLGYNLHAGIRHTRMDAASRAGSWRATASRCAIDDIATRRRDRSTPSSQAGATSVGGVRFDIAGARRLRSARRCASRLPTRARRAEAAAAGAGRSLDRILKIEDCTGDGRRFRCRRTDGDGVRRRRSADAVEPGLIEIRGARDAHRVDEMTALRSPKPPRASPP